LTYLRGMRIVTLEEHVSFPHIVREFIPGGKPFMPELAPLLEDVDGPRLAAMDEQGITFSVLSVVGPGAETLPGSNGVAMARAVNDVLAARIQPRPDRFGAFAHLPMAMPAAAADELDRTVGEYGFKGALIKGMTSDKFLDDPSFAPVLERAAVLGVPLYLHPGSPPAAVAKAYYQDLPAGAGVQLSLSGWGWHAETALHILRLIVSGTFDRYPDLRVIIGHMGEMLPMMMARCDDKFKVGAVGAQQRPISQTLRDQVYVTTSGLFTMPPLQAAIDTFGLERVLFSVDYPFSTFAEGRRFLDTLSPWLSMSIAHANADRVLGL